mgnify:FL=1|tara:strand:+ start:44 stop:544 length:501 start_codon:yes stop_codon:yes gene_type:complete
MSNFARKTKQRIIDEYLQATGYNMFKPDEFVDWLAGQPEHEMYDAFYGIDDATAARQWRIDMARRMASGLRIVVEQTDIKQSDKVLTIEYPAYISPVAKRKEGGGYEPFDPENEESQAELRRQAGVSLAAWLNRYRGCTENIGLDVAYIEEMVRILRDEKDEADVA